MKDDFPLFELLSAATKKDRKYYSKLSDINKKKFSPFIVQKWLSNPASTLKREYYLQCVNSIINTKLFDMANHPELIYMLMTVIGDKKVYRHEWIGITKKTESKKLLDAFFLNLNPGVNRDELDILRTIYTLSDIIDIAINMGYQKLAIEELKEAWAIDNGERAKKSRKRKSS